MDLKGNLIMNSGYSDRRFLIEFIITNYLGPDVNSHSPRCSVVQRLMTGSPPYILSDLGPSYVSISFLERLYYYLLRDAFPNLVLDLNMFHMYLKGKLILPGSDFTQDTQQFTSFFPLDLHQQIWYPDSFRVIKGVVLIDDPSTSCMIGEDLNRFRSLTGISTLKLNISECLGFQLGHPSSKKDPSKKTSKSDGPTLMPLLSIPDIDECSLDSSLILTGTARKGPFGPSVGVVDIGISKGAYLFRVSLPGVKKDSNQFSCDIESDGRVQIRGVLTGGRTIMKQSRIFQMNTRQLCPPGPFTLSFSLPGPVDPRLFAPNFRSDGIFEGVVVKH
uniref:SHSP domain-containing protein n=1 Tax=Cajanus cajan TaxID=3821 RepID=A0A151T821_CAJCA|nr:hypothetical protein KK1_017720 [Cajanus cajan]